MSEDSQVKWINEYVGVQGDVIYIRESSDPNGTYVSATALSWLAAMSLRSKHEIVVEELKKFQKEAQTSPFARSMIGEIEKRAALSRAEKTTTGNNAAMAFAEAASMIREQLPKRDWYQ